MATFTYTAKRNVKAGHSAGTEYTITIDLQSLDGDQPTIEKNESVSLSGNVVTTLYRIDRFVDVATDYIQTSGGTPDIDDFTEFFDSVAGGELFVFNDGSDHNVILASNPARTRNGLFFSYSFKLRKL